MTGCLCRHSRCVPGSFCLQKSQGREGLRSPGTASQASRRALLVASEPQPGRSAAGWGGSPRRPPLSFSPPFFLPSLRGLCRALARRPRCSPAAPAPSCKGEIAKLVAIMTLHSGGRLPLNVSAPRPAGPNQRGPPCCPPSLRPPTPPPPPAHKSGEQNPPRISPSLC